MQATFRDWRKDWRQWSQGERLVAVIIIALLFAVLPTALRFGAS
jgi:hypothetical protein